MAARKRLLAALAVACTLSPAVYAAALKLYPVRIVLTPAEPVQTMTIHNEGASPARVQLRVFAWRQVDGENVFEQTRDVLANPATFEVGPGGDQIARFGLRTTLGKLEKSYRVFLQEVPSDRPREPGEVQTLLRISVPIFVPAVKPMGRLEWHLSRVGNDQAMLAIRNTGTTHVQLSGVTLTKGGATLADKDSSIYLLPGSSQRLTLDVARPLSVGESLTLLAKTDQGELTAEILTETPSHEAGNR